MRSMTGFGSAAVQDGALSVRVEIRAVNHRYLQVKARLPAELAQLETEVENWVKRVLERGAVTVSVSVERAAGADVAKIDTARARAYHDQLLKLADELDLDDDIRIETLVALPGVVASPDELAAGAEEARVVEKAIKVALEGLVRMRAAEGQSLHADLTRNAAGVSKLLEKVSARMPEVVVEHHRALQKRVDDLLGGRDLVKQSDLARELALLAERMDVSEELTRLGSHLGQLDLLLAKEKPVGRELDFLVQEFLREANTIGAKCSDATIAHAVVELKTLIERLREQVQNVE